MTLGLCGHGCVHILSVLGELTLNVHRMSAVHVHVLSYISFNAVRLHPSRLVWCGCRLITEARGVFDTERRCLHGLFTLFVLHAQQVNSEPGS